MKQGSIGANANKESMLLVAKTEKQKNKNNLVAGFSVTMLSRRRRSVTPAVLLTLGP